MISLLSILNSELVNGLANGGQIADLALNIAQTSNDQLMQELKKQDQEFLNQILDINKEQINLLKELKEQNNIIINLLNKNFINKEKEN